MYTVMFMTKYVNISNLWKAFIKIDFPNKTLLSVHLCIMFLLKMVVPNGTICRSSMSTPSPEYQRIQ